MNKTNFEIPSQQADEIRNMLSHQGLSQSEIDKILLGDYSEIQSPSELEAVFGAEGKFEDVISMLRDGYSEIDMQTKYPKQYEQFKAKLDEMNIDVEDARTINQYTEGSNMINSYKRGMATKEEIQEGLLGKLKESLLERGFKEENIPQIEKYINGFDYDQPLYKIFEKSNMTLQQANYPSSLRASINTSIRDLSRLHHIDKTIEQLDGVMKKSRIPESTKLYRAVSSKNGLFKSESAYSSTSPIQSSSFDKYGDMDVLMELYVPKGTQGLDISSFSDYGETEQEVLLGSNDMFFTDIQRHVIGEDGKSKTIVKALLLSKDKECYKGIDRETNPEQIKKQEEIHSTYEQTIEQTNLPTKQGRFSKLFNQFRARFAKGYKQNEPTEIDTPKQEPPQPRQEFKTKEKKSWELEPEEKARIQKSTAEIAKKYREQQETQSQSIEQAQVEQTGYNNNQIQNANIPQQPIQPQMDMGGMEL